MEQRGGDRSSALVPGAGESDFDRAVDEVSAAVMAASRLLVAISARALASVAPQLTLPQLRTLVGLEGGGPGKLADLAATLGVNPSTAMRTVDKLEALGLVSRRTNPENRREVVLSLTAEGHRLVEQVLAHRHREIAAIVSRLPADQQSGLLTSLTALLDAAGEPAFGPTSPVDPMALHG
ncbi:MarR family transcriptional regulator [Kitasatospora sp. RB6PN24]|uniref:MarR family winged helix-turn-helix transcriptional regulator n=1 Tax=Kitasatospora humi TaxID=2893891 RepID=UPI001E2F9429|nr:MarR family transcriptional regulator [Kitasatospora humi]MCC9310265.1 MarR family transcriptional regulator [Kitasatospora humi]